MPRRMPHLPGFNLASAWQPAHDVSGDYLAAFKLNESHAALCVADVAGKGFPAALLMSNMQAALTSLASENFAPSELCAKLNRIMCGNTPLRKFITCFYGDLDVSNRKLTFTNAGHNPPMLFRGMADDVAVVRLDTGGPVIGLIEHCAYQQGSITLTAGDLLVAYTDGISEAMNAANEEWGEDRMMAAVVPKRATPAGALIDSLMTSADAFVAGAPQHDDMTLLVVRATER